MTEKGHILLFSVIPTERVCVYYFYKSAPEKSHSWIRNNLATRRKEKKLGIYQIIRIRQTGNR